MLRDSIFEMLDALRAQQDERVTSVAEVEEEELLEEQPIEYSGFVIVQLVGGALDDPSWLPDGKSGLREEAERRGFSDLVALLDRFEVDGQRLIYNLWPEEVWAFEYPHLPFPETRQDGFSNNGPKEFKEPEKATYQEELADEAMSEQAEVVSDEPSSLNLYWRVDMREGPDGAEPLVAELYSLGQSRGVGMVYREMKVSLAQFPPANDVIFLQQAYLHPAPIGIDVRAAWNRFAPGQMVNNVRFADVEEGWFRTHPDLPTWVRNVVLSAGTDNPLEARHGASVLGILMAEQNAFGIFGQTAGLTQNQLRLASNFNGSSNNHVAAAIAGVALGLSAGDVLLIEIERSGRAVELDCADFAAIYRAVQRGIIVIEAAGNGNVNLDAAYATRICEVDGQAGLRNSGAIIVGACNPRTRTMAGQQGHSRLSGSSYGLMVVDCHAWGSSVLTTDDTGKVCSFSGTSAAAAIIAGAVVLIQSLYKARNPGQTIAPSAMRNALKDTVNGTLQLPLSAQHIGPMPDLGRVLPTFGL